MKKQGEEKETTVVASSEASQSFYLQEPRKCDKVPTKLQHLLENVIKFPPNSSTYSKMW